MKQDAQTVNITIIGGGSYNWTPKLLSDLALTQGLRGQLALVDVDPAALDLMVPLGQKTMQELAGDFVVRGTTNRQEALDGADYVVLTINTGGYEATRQDIEIPERYGVVQTVGDTVGPGGIMRGLRNVPVVVEIAQDMELLCPDAWLLNYSNPMCVLTSAVNWATDIKAVGLCHELLGLEMKLRFVWGSSIGVDNPAGARLKLAVGGINHFSWVTAAHADGVDLFPGLLEYARHYKLPDIAYDEFDPVGDLYAVKLGLLETTGCLGVAGDRHIVEFWPGFISPEFPYSWRYGVKRTTPDDFERWYREAGSEARAMLNGEEDVLSDHSGEIVWLLVDAIEHDRGQQFFVNLPNRGQISNLPLDAVVETYAVADAQGLTPVTFGDLPASVAPITALHADIQEMVVEAALTGDRDLALQAFLLDPMIRDFNDGRRMFDELCAAQDLFAR
ncbi:MAG: hypothetical protein KKA73_20945 [Chloroflexi bacterium]|nr:hypothetical protein [Chloroflexota bacterium]MBU1750160.1 hypothetical protein [Chloroflexota bacterium]MBU1879083.1 hypothetical protein [Chloroflexota bacterium]